MSTAESTSAAVSADRKDAGTALFFSERQFIRGLYLVICLMAAIAATFVYRMSLLEEETQWALHSHEVCETLDALLSTAINAATTSRSYSPTWGGAFPEPLVAAEHKIAPLLDRLNVLVADNPQQMERAEKLAALITRQMELVRLDTDLRKPRKLTAASAFADSEDESHAYDAVRRSVEEMQDAEMALLQERQNQSEHATVLALSGVALGTLLATGITGMVVVLIRRHFEGNRRARAALRNTNALLDQRIAQRTAALREADVQLRLANAAFKNVQESIIITTLDYHIVAVNPAFSEVTEYSREEVIGKHVRVLHFDQQDTSFYQQMWRSLVTTGSWQGEIWNRRRNGEIHQVWLSVSTIRGAANEPIYYIGVATDISRMHHAKTHLEHLAHHDPLTGLPNRLLLNLRLKHTVERARRGKTMCAVLFIDLDHFKPVNDTFGHAAGDEVLRLAAGRMRERLRDIDTLARIGGDEFVIVLEEIGSPENAAEIAHSLIKQLCSPFILGNGQAVSIGASIGISTYPGHATRPDGLLASADSALYAAKQAGRGTWHFAAPRQEQANSGPART